MTNKGCTTKDCLRRDIVWWTSLRDHKNCVMYWKVGGRDRVSYSALQHKRHRHVEKQVSGGAEQSTRQCPPAPSPHCPLSPGCQLPHLAAHRPGQLPLAERPRGVWRHGATHVGWPGCCRQWLAGLVRGACQTQRWTVQPLSASAPSPPQPWVQVVGGCAPQPAAQPQQARFGGGGGPCGGAGGRGLCAEAPGEEGRLRTQAQRPALRGGKGAGVTPGSTNQLKQLGGQEAPKVLCYNLQSVATTVKNWPTLGHLQSLTNHPSTSCNPLCICLPS